MGASSKGRNATAKSASTGRSSSGLRAMARWTLSTTGTGSPPAVAWTLSGGNIVLPRTVVCPCIAHLTGLATGRGRVGRVQYQALRVTLGARAYRASRHRRAGGGTRLYRGCIRNWVAAQCDRMTDGRLRGPGAGRIDGNE